MSGYHAISSVIAKLDYCDELELTIGAKPGAIAFECSFSEELKKHIDASDDVEVAIGRDNICSEDNLVVRAVKAVLNDVGLDPVSLGIKISLMKRIPFGAGLGGGSADAAAVICGLNDMLELQLDTERLINIAASIGSDVPALLFSKLVMVQGRGELLSLLEPEADSEDIWSTFASAGVLIIKPAINIPTSAAYRALDIALDLPPILDEQALEPSKNCRELLRALGLRAEPLGHRIPSANHLTFSSVGDTSPEPFDSAAKWPIFRHFHNDFETVLLEEFSELDAAFTVLKECGAYRVLLAGSGSAVVGFLPSLDDARQLRAEIVNRLPAGSFVDACGFYPNSS